MPKSHPLSRDEVKRLSFEVLRLHHVGLQVRVPVCGPGRCTLETFTHVLRSNSTFTEVCARSDNAQTFFMVLQRNGFSWWPEWRMQAVVDAIRYTLQVRTSYHNSRRSSNIIFSSVNVNAVRAGVSLKLSSCRLCGWSGDFVVLISAQLWYRQLS